MLQIMGTQANLSRLTLYLDLHKQLKHQWQQVVLRQRAAQLQRAAQRQQEAQ